MKKSVVAAFVAASLLMAHQPAPAQSSTSSEARQVITSADQLPRRVVKLEKLPS
jgi:hypothetical protein